MRGDLREGRTINVIYSVTKGSLARYEEKEQQKYITTNELKLHNFVLLSAFPKMPWGFGKKVVLDEDELEAFIGCLEQEGKVRRI